MSRPVASVIYVGLAIVLAALVWMVLGVIGAGADAAGRPVIEWIGQTFGPAGLFGAGALLIGGLGWWAFSLQRGEQRRLYAIDRTIHVEPKHKAPLWAVIGTTIVFGMVGFGMLGGLLSLFF